MQAGAQRGVREQARDQDQLRGRGGVHPCDQAAVQPRHQAAVQRRGGQSAQAVQQTGTRHF